MFVITHITVTLFNVAISIHKIENIEQRRIFMAKRVIWFLNVLNAVWIILVSTS